MFKTMQNITKMFTDVTCVSNYNQNKQYQSYNYAVVARGHSTDLLFKTLTKKTLSCEMIYNDL